MMEIMGDDMDVTSSNPDPMISGVHANIALDLAASQSHLSNSSCNFLLSPLVGCSTAITSVHQQNVTGYLTVTEGGDSLMTSGNGSNLTLTSMNVPSVFTQMSTTSRNCVIAYIILFIISATGNLSVFFSVLQQLRKSKSRICVLILHLSLADLMVTFFVIPFEVVWRFTVSWYGGNLLCKICQFARAFGLYLSSFVLICISLDRYFAIIHPLRTSGAKRRGRVMLSCAWISAAICSLPQSVIFHVQHHPVYPSFQQCVSFGYFVNDMDEMAYNITSLTAMYLLPLVVIIFTYGRILYKIFRKSRQHQQVMKSCKNLKETTGRILLRRSDAANNMERARNRTLRLTLVIVIMFLCSWTPYTVMLVWYMVDRDGAQKVDKNVQEALFIMAVANSCVNPLVYGTYTRECRATVTHCCMSSSNSRRRNLHRPSSRNSKCTISSRVMSTTTFHESASPSYKATRQSIKGLGGGGRHYPLESTQDDEGSSYPFGGGTRENKKSEAITISTFNHHKDPTRHYRCIQYQKGEVDEL